MVENVVLVELVDKSNGISISWNKNDVRSSIANTFNLLSWEEYSH